MTAQEALDLAIRRAKDNSWKEMNLLSGEELLPLKKKTGVDQIFKIAVERPIAGIAIGVHTIEGELSPIGVVVDGKFLTNEEYRNVRT